MKTRIAAAIFAVAALLTPACEQHDWKDTSQLFKSGHGDHAAGEHGKEAGHGAEAAPAHGEKKAAH